MTDPRHPLAGGAVAAPELAFTVEGAAVPHAAAPTIVLELRIDRTGGAPVRSLTLAVQVRIAAPRRSHDAQTKERLRGVFGTEEQWSQSLRSLLWARPTIAVPAFADSTVAEVLLPCTYDMEAAHAAYLGAVREGTIPVELLFSGTVFYAGEDGRLQAGQVSWEHEASYDLPAAVWQEAMDRHFPGARWLRLDVDRYDRLVAFRNRQAHPTWEAAVDALLERADG